MDEITTHFLTDLQFSAASHAKVEWLTGSCADCPDDQTLHLRIEDHYAGWVLFGGRPTARRLARAMLEFVEDDSNWGGRSCLD